MFLKVVAVLVPAIAAVLIFAAMKPKQFRIERSTVIEADAAKVYGLIADFHQWPRWAPTDREDASVKRTFGGAERGVGASSDWSGSGNSGQGRMTVTKAIAPKLVIVDVDWRRPFVAHNVNEFRLEEGTSGKTQVSWTMTGPSLFPMRVMSVFVNLDRKMGKHFEDGLANLKAVAEQP